MDGSRLPKHVGEGTALLCVLFVRFTIRSTAEHYLHLSKYRNALSVRFIVEHLVTFPLGLLNVLLMINVWIQTCRRKMCRNKYGKVG